VGIGLCRIDERLLHGQVLVGWGGRLGIAHYVVVDDVLAASDWERELYASGTPDGADSHFLSVSAAVEELSAFEDLPGSTAVLTRDTETMRTLAEAGLLEEKRVNVGGLHPAEGRRRALDYVFLGDPEIDDLRTIADRSRSVSARDLPSSPEVRLEELIRAAGRA